MKQILSAMLLCLFLFSGLATAYDSGHIYINGIVNSVSSGTIAISHLTYKIDQKCKVVIQYKESGSFHEKPGRLWDINTGETVTAKEIGAVIYEIIIEEWRR
ncbi:MAG: hypothetical protein WC769_02725 [Thermodesulfovibrionales bacterium]